MKRPVHERHGIVARIQRHRRYELLLEAVRRVAAEVPEAHLLVLGRGTRARELAHDPVRRLGLEGRVSLPGYVGGEDYPRALACFDMKVFLVPGTDGTCRAVREAMAMGIPIVATRRGFLPEIVRDGVDGFIIELSQVLGREVTPKEALHQIAIEILETDPASIAAGRVEREGAVNTVLYRCCPGCRRSEVETDDGPMEIAPEVIERLEKTKTVEKFVIRPEEEALPKNAAAPETPAPLAEAVPAPPATDAQAPKPPIAPANTRPFLEKLFLRDGRRCSNPLCRRPLPLQGNHMKPRSEGGETALHNENSFCIICHALHTAGLLDISGNPIEGLTFTPRGVKLARALTMDKVSVEAMPVVMAQAAAPAAVSGGAPRAAEGVSLASEEASALENATLGLVSLGYRKTDAAPRARRALDKLRTDGTKITSETLLKAALH